MLAKLASEAQVKIGIFLTVHLSLPVQEQDTAQYIVVSHKPEVYELARTLVGVYQDKQSSASLTVQL